MGPGAVQSAQLSVSGFTCYNQIVSRLQANCPAAVLARQLSGLFQHPAEPFEDGQFDLVVTDEAMSMQPRLICQDIPSMLIRRI